MKKRLRAGAKLIVIDPRAIDLVRTPHVQAAYHLPLLPGTNVAILSAMAHVIVTEGLADETFELIAQSSFDYMFDPEMGSPNGAEGPSVMFGASGDTAMMQDVRFTELCARLGLCAYWVKSGCWPDCADEGVLHYDFRAECRRLAGA